MTSSKALVGSKAQSAPRLSRPVLAGRNIVSGVQENSQSGARAQIGTAATKAAALELIIAPLAPSALDRFLLEGRQ
jgi:hypothetical protein